MSITVLRLGHRIFRDQRITTHCGLTARAFNADSMVYCGERDEEMEKSIREVVGRWGNPFEINYEKNWKHFIKKCRDEGKTIILLTMYGANLSSIKNELKKKDIIVIIGSEKIPSDIYSLIDYQVSITNQPISEVSALGVFLDRFFDRTSETKFKNAKIEIVPQLKGKKTLSKL